MIEDVNAIQCKSVVVLRDIEGRAVDCTGFLCACVYKGCVNIKNFTCRTWKICYLIQESDIRYL